MAENTQHQVGDSTVELVGTKMEFLGEYEKENNTSTRLVAPLKKESD
jgi:hypothetical protein